jgi:hypothetical protein
MQTNLSKTVAANDTLPASSLVQGEIAAFAATARRGNVLPVCMRLASGRPESAWADRAAMAFAVGPVCRPEVLDMACAFMPRAVEPRLLRAAASIVAARVAGCSAERDAHLDSARRDLDEAARLDIGDITVRVLLAELGRVSWTRRAA